VVPVSPADCQSDRAAAGAVSTAGPELDAPAQPELFREIALVAQAAGGTYSIARLSDREFNAWVTYRGGVMDFGSAPVIGLGLPLLASLTRQQFRFLLAHEFGHYTGGDTMVGGWVYKTRASIQRVIGELEERRNWLRSTMMLNQPISGTSVTSFMTLAPSDCAFFVAAEISSTST